MYEKLDGMVEVKKMADDLYDKASDLYYRFSLQLEKAVREGESGAQIKERIDRFVLDTLYTEHYKFNLDLSKMIALENRKIDEELEQMSQQHKKEEVA